MKTRMQPIGNAWQKLPRIVRDLVRRARQADRHSRCTAPTPNSTARCSSWSKIRSRIWFATVPITASRAPPSGSPPARPPKGTIRLSACHQGGHIIIEIADDGRGLDRGAHTAPRPSSRALPARPEIAAKSEAEICNLIFTPGFSTAAQVTSISGRGVGMDVVRANMEQIGGTVDLKSVSGVGTTFTIKIPLTLAIVSALIVEAGGERFAIPQLSVLELVRACSQRRASHRADQGHAGAAAAQQAVAAHQSEGNPAARRKRRRQRLRRRRRRSAARSSASSSTACSTPRRS